ncbi:MAG TPA: acyl-CoA carboxylase subunit epsilon [Jatrophihabitans sp.]|nr:acyl-CoA carboxylase subunit epsilon [Jatrophihabitans sp.]
MTDTPLLQVVSGDPSPDELAAVTVLLTALGRPSDEPAEAADSTGWADLSLRIRRLPAPGPGAWRASAWS